MFTCAKPGSFRPIKLPLVFLAALAIFFCGRVTLRVLVREDGEARKDQMDATDVDAELAQHATVVCTERGRIVQQLKNLEGQRGQKIGDGRLEDVATFAVVCYAED